MYLRLKNIGKISSADIELKGITVIAGENNTGKSTVGKVLFSIFNSFYHFETTMKRTRTALLAQEIASSFEEYAESKREISSLEVSKILFSLDDSKVTAERMQQLLFDNIYYPFSFDDEDFDEEATVFLLGDDYVDKALSLYNKYKDIPDDIVYQNIFNQRIRNDFHSQINNIYSKSGEGQISLIIKDKEVNIAIKNNKVTSVSNMMSLKTEVIYLDDPFILDRLNTAIVIYSERNRSSDIRKQHLANKLINGRKLSEIEEAINEFIINDQISAILSKINSVCDGALTQTKDGFIYSVPNELRGLSVENVSLGLKTFIIIKTLLINGALERNGTIILDEPEIHLHPQWQLLFAEIIVLLQKEFGLHILLTTHSPYFLRAIQVYSAKHNIADLCKYYLSEVNEDIANITDVTDNIEQIYAKLSRPLQGLEDMRWQHD